MKQVILVALMGLVYACSSTEQPDENRELWGAHPSVLYIKAVGGSARATIVSGSHEPWTQIGDVEERIGISADAPFVEVPVSTDPATGNVTGEWFQIRHTDDPYEVEVELMPNSGERRQLRLCAYDSKTGTFLTINQERYYKDNCDETNTGLTQLDEFTAAGGTQRLRIIEPALAWGSWYDANDFIQNLDSDEPEGYTPIDVERDLGVTYLRGKWFEIRHTDDEMEVEVVVSPNRTGKVRCVICQLAQQTRRDGAYLHIKQNAAP